MLQINIRITEICLKVKTHPEYTKSRELNPWYIDFYCKLHEEKYRLVKQMVQFRQQKLPIAVEHQVYAKKISQKQEKVGYKVLLNTKDEKGKKIYLKHVGKCKLELRKYIHLDQYPALIQLILPFTNPQDSSAYIKLSMKIKQIKQFANYYKIQAQTKKQIMQMANYSELSLAEQQINQQLNRQQTDEKKFQLQRLINRSQRYQQQIRHLNNENKDLVQQIRQRKEAIELFSKIESDKIEMLREKNIKLQIQFVRSKQSISHIVNLINEYGRVDIVEDITNLLAS